MKANLRKYFEDVDATCTRCGGCDRAHEKEGFPSFQFGDLARTLLDIDDAIAGGAKQAEVLTDDVVYPIRACALCNECTARCPKQIDAKQFMSNARAYLIEVRPWILDNYRHLRTDLAVNLFSAFRDVQGIHYDDLLLDGDTAADSDSLKTLFFAGCTLSSYTPDLTDAICSYLERNERIAGMTTLCCGNPIRNSGALDEFDAYAAHLGELLTQKGIGRIIVACPNCFDALTELVASGVIGPDIELVPLSEILLAHGTCVDADLLEQRGIHSVSVHDACHDRMRLRFADSIRALLPESVEVREMTHKGLRTICCGSGGNVSCYDPDCCATRMTRRAEEFSATGADALIVGCISCASTLTQAVDAPVVHYLELVFGHAIDHAALDAAAAKIYDEGGYDLTSRMADETPVFPPA